MFRKISREGKKKIELHISVMLAIELTREALTKVTRTVFVWHAANIFTEPSKGDMTRIVTVHGVAQGMTFTSECHLRRTYPHGWELWHMNLEVAAGKSQGGDHLCRIAGQQGELKVQEFNPNPAMEGILFTFPVSRA